MYEQAKSPVCAMQSMPSLSQPGCSKTLIDICTHKQEFMPKVGLQIAVLTGLPRLLFESRPCIVNRAAAVLAEQESANLLRRVLYIITCRVASITA